MANSQFDSEEAINEETIGTSNLEIEWSWMKLFEAEWSWMKLNEVVWSWLKLLEAAEGVRGRRSSKGERAVFREAFRIESVSDRGKNDGNGEKE